MRCGLSRCRPAPQKEMFFHFTLRHSLAIFSIHSPFHRLPTFTRKTPCNARTLAHSHKQPMSTESGKRSLEAMQKIISARFDSHALDRGHGARSQVLDGPTCASSEASKRARTEADEAAEVEAVRIKEVEVDIVCEDIYEQMEQQAMMEILGGLEAELTDEYGAVHSEATAASAQPATASLLWDVVATPLMMSSFGATVRSSLPIPAM